MRTVKALIRLGGCPGWSESSLWAQVILFVLSCTGSNMSWSRIKWHGPSIVSYEPHHEKKTCLCHMRTTKVQISLRLHAVWSASLLFAAWVSDNISSFFVQNFKPLASLCSWAGWFESYLVENPEDRFSRVMAHISLCISADWPVFSVCMRNHWLSIECLAKYSDHTVQMCRLICVFTGCKYHLSHDMTKPTKWVCTQQRLRSDWAWRKLGSLATHWAHSEDSDQTGQIPRLIWVFAGRTLTLLVLSRGGSFCWFCCSSTHTTPTRSR